MTGVDEGFGQIPEEAAPPFGASIGGEGTLGPVSAGAGGFIDGTPMRLSAFIILVVIGLILFHYADFRFHVNV